MAPKISVLTAETEIGRQAIQEVMAHSYQTDIDSVPGKWALVRLQNQTPVSFALVDPGREMQFPRGRLTYGFIDDVATRQERRGEGHFRGIIEEAFRRLKLARIPLVATHGRFPLYRRFGFDVFTYHSGIFISVNQIERIFGVADQLDGSHLVQQLESNFIQDDLFLLTHAQAADIEEACLVLRTAASLARKQGKTRILIEHPDAPSYGSTYPMNLVLDTPLTSLARSCGANICVQGANPEDSSIPDADWIKVLDAGELVRQVIPLLNLENIQAPDRPVWMTTDAGSFLLQVDSAGIYVKEENQPGSQRVHWSASILGQIITGFLSVEKACLLSGTSLPIDTRIFLDRLFPPCWRLSRNESWTYKI